MIAGQLRPMVFSIGSEAGKQARFFAPLTKLGRGPFRNAEQARFESARHGVNPCRRSALGSAAGRTDRRARNSRSYSAAISQTSSCFIALFQAMTLSRASWTNAERRTTLRNVSAI